VSLTVNEPRNASSTTQRPDIVIIPISKLNGAEPEHRYPAIAGWDLHVVLITKVI
jgi:hypothetical protein